MQGQNQKLMMISFDVEKAFDKVQPFDEKNTQQTEEYLNTIKAT